MSSIYITVRIPEEDLQKIDKLKVEKQKKIGVPLSRHAVILSLIKQGLREEGQR